MKDKVIITPRNIPYLEASYLTQENETAYEEACKEFNSERARNTLNIPFFPTSSLFKVLLLNQKGIRTGTLPELDRIAEENPYFLKGYFEDVPSVVLRSINDPFNSNHTYLAKSLARLIHKRKFNNPVVINGLEIVEDSNSTYGLNFKKGENFDFFEAPELSMENNGKRFNIGDERGIPIFDPNGNRALFTNLNGLSKLTFDGRLNLSSNYNNLSNSYYTSRVVLVNDKKIKGAKK